MKYLLTYAYEGNRNGASISGQGSVNMTVDKDKITPEVIADAIEWVKNEFDKTNIQINLIVPMGWFKYDEEVEADE